MTDEACICIAMRRTTRQVTAAYEAALAPCELRITQLSLLRMLQKLGPQSVTRLAEIGDLDRSTMGRNLDPLERRGLIRLDRGRDQRERLVSLTPEGAAAIEQAMPLWRAAQAKVRAAIPPEALALLTDLHLS